MRQPNGQNKRRWWLRAEGRTAGEKSLDSGNISKEVPIGLADGLEA